MRYILTSILSLFFLLGCDSHHLTDEQFCEIVVIPNMEYCEFHCASDVNEDGVVDTVDLLIVLAEWGRCEEVSL
jgi:hypothetical protein